MTDAKQPEAPAQEPPKADPLAVANAHMVAVFTDDGDPVYHRGRLRYVCRREDFEGTPTELDSIDPRAWAL